MELFKLLGKIVIDADGVDAAINGIIGKVETLGNKVQTAGEKISSIGTKMTIGITTPLMAIGGKAIGVAADFESAMSEVGAISGATGDDFIALSDKAKEMGEKTKFSASESAEALKYMAMAGWKTEDMLSGLEGVMNLAAASGEDLGTTSDIVTDALTAFGMTAADSGHFADILAAASGNANTNVGMMGETFKYAAPLAGALGYSAEDVALAIGLMANSGIKASQAGTALRSMFTRLAKPTEESATAMDAVGVSITNSDGSMKSLNEVLQDMRKGFSNLTEAEKTQYAAMLAGQEAMSGLLAIVNASDSDFEKLSSSINDCDGSTKRMADTMNDNLSGQITLLKSQLEGLAIQFTTLIMPYLRQGVEWLSKICDWISGLDDGTKKVIITIAGIAAAVGPVLMVGGKVVTGIGKIISALSGVIAIGSSLSPVISGVIVTGEKLLGGIGSLIGKVTTGLLPALAMIPAPVWVVIGVLTALVAIGVAVYKNWDEIKAWAEKTWMAIKETVKNATDGIVECVKGIAEKFSELKENVSQKVQELKENVSNKFLEMKEAITSKAEELKNAAVEKFNNLKERASELFHAMKEAVASKIEEMKENAVSKIQTMRDKISNGFQEMKERAAEKFNDLKERWTSKFTETKEKMIAESEEMKNGVSEKLEELREKAIEKIRTLKEQISDKYNEMKQAISTHTSEIVAKGVAGFNNIREKGSAALASLKEFAVSKFVEMSSAARDKFGEVASSITGIFDKAKEKLHGIVEKVKGFFNFEWKLPEIKLPHFSIDGEFSINPPSIPHIGVEWYAKGGVMNEPTAFGVNPNTGKVMVGGEAGAEAIAPIETLKAYIREAVCEDNERLCNVLNAILGILSKYLPEMSSMEMVMDTGEVVGRLAQPLSDELGRIVYMRGRKN